MPGGRKPKYTPERVEIITKAIREGKTQEYAYTSAGISKQTFHVWMSTKNDFRDAVKKAESEYLDWCNAELVKSATASLVELIKGWKQVTKKTRHYVKDGRKCEETTIEEKICPPSATALIFALCNRAPELWSNKHVQELTGRVETENKSGISLEGVSDDLLAQVIEAINRK